jgi:hypothetical protein
MVVIGHIVGSAVSTVLKQCVGEQSRGANFIWRLPRIATDFDNLRDRATSNEADLQALIITRDRASKVTQSLSDARF